MHWFEMVVVALVKHILVVPSVSVDTAGLDSLHIHPYFRHLIQARGRNLENYSSQAMELTSVLVSFSLPRLQLIELLELDRFRLDQIDTRTAEYF